MKKIILFLIKIYQKTLSPDHGWIKYGACRFHPTCSQYTYEAVKRFGVAKGLALGSKRVIRCHPFNPGGVDEVPKR